MSISNGGVYNPATHRITWPTLPAMASGTERLLTVRIPVRSNATAFTATNTAVISSDVFDPITENNRSRSEEHTSELQSLMRISYAVFCLKKKSTQTVRTKHNTEHNTTLLSPPNDADT